jgi:type I restriction enzyme S subunit
MSNRVLLESIVAKIGNGIDAEQIDQPSDGMLPISRIETIWDGVIDFERVKYAQVTKAEIDKYALKSGDILFSHINSPTHIGKTAIYRSDQTLIHGINLLLIRVDQKKCYPEYLNYYFKSKNVRALFRARCKKAVNQASLNQPDILELEVPLPPLTEQKRIASLLARADRLRQLRRTAHDLSASVLQSVFLEMFGDLPANEKNWETVEFGEVIQIISGHGFKLSEYSPSGVKLLQIANVSFQEIIWDNLAYLPEEYMDSYSNLVLQERDLLMALNRPILGDRIKFAFLKSKDAPSILYQRVGKFVIDKKRLHPSYLFGFMLTQYFYNELKNRLAGSDQPYINPTELVKMKFFLPPLSLQEEFAGVVARVESLRGRMSESERQAQNLFESLLAQSFGG